MIDKADLWLVRHGAVAPKVPGSVAQNRARQLTPPGRKQAKRAGKVLDRIAPSFDALYTSPLPRCVQSAELIAARTGGSPQILDVLHDVVKTRPKRVLDSVKDGGAVLMVGHGPEFQAVIKALTGRSVWLSRGAICQLACKDGQWSVGQLLQPADVKRMLG